MIPLILAGGDKYSMTSILAGSNSNPSFEIRCLRTLSSFTMKWHFFQFNTKILFSRLCKNIPRLSKDFWNDPPNTEKLSMKISMECSMRSENMVILHLLKVVGALHNPNDILLKAKVLWGHVKVVYWSSWSISI